MKPSIGNTVMNGVRQFFSRGFLLFQVVSLHHIFVFWFLKLKSTQMYRPQKGNSGVSINDSLFKFWLRTTDMEVSGLSSLVMNIRFCVHCTAFVFKSWKHWMWLIWAENRMNMNSSNIYIWFSAGAETRINMNSSYIWIWFWAGAEDKKNHSLFMTEI